METTPQTSPLTPFTGGERTPFDYNAYREGQRGLSSAEFMADPERMEDIRRYMVSRKGTQFRDADDEEVFNAYINHWRFFSVNEVTTAGELVWVNRASEEEQAIAARAYQRFDELGHAFTRDGLGGAGDAVWDYGRALITSPSTWAGALAGRVASAPLRAAATERIGQVVGKAVAAPGATAAGANVGLEAGEQVARQIAAQAVRSAATREVATAVTVDAAGSAFQDYLYQRTLMNVGAQDRYNALQSILVAGTGVLAGGVASIPYVARQQQMADLGIRSSITARRKADEAFEKAKPEIEKALEAFESEFFDWTASVARGEQAAMNDYDIILRAPRMLLDPDPANKASIVGAMVRAGVKLNPGETTRQIAAFAKNISPERRQMLDDLFKKYVSPDMTFDQMVDIAVMSVSKSGETLKLAKDAADALSKVITARRMADDTIVGLAETARRAAETVTEPTPQVVEYVQSMWRRALVSHPATAAINVLGWAQVESAKALAEIIQGGVVGSVALAMKYLSPKASKAGQWADRALLDSRALRNAQIYKMRTLLDPYATKNTFDVLMKEVDPRQRKMIDRTLFSGVEASSERYNIKPNKAVKVGEAYLEAAGKYSGTFLQDGVTKSMSFMFELDKQSRLAGLGPINNILMKGDLSVIPDDVFTKAVNQTLKSTMSHDYTKGYGWLSRLAQMTENLSNTPGLGFLFPFGRFLNNQLAFVMEYSPIALLPHLKNFRRLGAFADPDFHESAAKALVGSYALYTLANYQRDAQERGLAWHEVEDSTGSVINIQNMAPVSAYFGIARLYNAAKDGNIPSELLLDVMEQLGPLGVVTKTQTNPLSDIVNAVNNAPDTQSLIAMFASVETIGTMAAGVASGFTRPLEPLDAMMGMATGSSGMADRRQLEGPERVLREATKYVDNIFAIFLNEVSGEPGNQLHRVGPPRQEATKWGRAVDPNPASRLLGRREETALTDIDRALRAVNIPAWTVQERSGIPEWDALVNEHITPMLDRRAREMMEGRLWKESGVRARERMVRALLSEVRRDSIEFILRELGAPAEVLNERRKFLNRPQTLRVDAMQALGYTEDPNDLSYGQLYHLNMYMDQLQERERLYISR